MKSDHLKPLIEPAPPAETPQQPLYPHTDLRFGPLGAGFAVAIQLADDIAIVKSFDAGAEYQICDILLKRRKALKQQQVEQLAVIKHVNSHKNGG